MIPKAAIDTFLKAPRDDHRWMKRLTHKQIDAALAALNPKVELEPGLRLHQKVCIYLGIAYPQFAYWLDLGTGKTTVILHILRYWWQTGNLTRALIFVKTNKAFPTWEAQIKRWNIDIPYVTLQDSSHEKWKTLERFKEGLIIVPYPGAVAMTTQRSKNKKGKIKFRLDPKAIKRLVSGVQALAMDESTCAGHFSSLTSQLCSRLRNQTEFCYALAGRPFGRDPTMLWAQHYIIDGGQTLGETLGLFRAAFYAEENNPWGNEWSKNYTFKKRMLPKLMDLVQHRSISYDEHECIDVPKWQPILEEVSLPEEANAYYEKVVEAVISAKGNLREMKNAFMRMRQLSSGFLGFRNDDSGAKVEIAFDENPKLERLLDVLSELPDDRKAVIFYDFTFSGRTIYQRLKELELQGIWVWGATKNAAELQHKFQTNPKCRVAVLNSRIGAYSLDGLQEVANYTMFYESPVAVIDRDQATKRLRRQGQKRKVFEFDFVTKGTLDKRILHFHREGGELLQALRANPRELLKELK